MRKRSDHSALYRSIIVNVVAWVGSQCPYTVVWGDSMNLGNRIRVHGKVVHGMMIRTPVEPKETDLILSIGTKAGFI